MLKIVITDDHKLFRDGLRRILETEPDFQVVAEAEDGEEALKVIREHVPDVVLFDINMPRVDGLQMVRELNHLKIRTSLIAVSAYDDENYLEALSAEGVLGFVLKSSGKGELVSAIRSACRGQPYVDPRVAGRLMMSFSRRKNENDMLADLTTREKEVLYWLSQGLSNIEIAERTVLSEKTVKNHVSHTLKKLDIRDRTQAAVIAWKAGFGQLSPDAMASMLGRREAEDSENSEV
ncbi:MAG: response regulator transcription factor [Synergistaceae bacterium]|jgi:DNA-binding NarL/FixJ family response regulator|nr:response regulator transcription factor [Synergistaceae bacterium]